MKDCFVEKTSSTEKFSMPLHHSHSFNEIYFLKNGKRTFFVEKDSYKLKPYDMISVTSNVLHRTEGGAFTRYLLKISPEQLNKHQANIFETLGHQVVSMTKDEALHIFNLLDSLLLSQEKLANGNDDAETFNYDTCVSYLLYSISKLKNFPSVKQPLPQSYKPRTKKILQYIQEHFADDLNLEFFCKMLFVSEPALCAQFKKDTGTTIMNHLLATRLNNAKLLLTSTSKKISQISDECGFSSPKYFNLIFKQNTNLSPSDFRKNNRDFFNHG